LSHRQFTAEIHSETGVPRQYRQPVIDGKSALRLTGDALVHLAEGMYGFCVLLSFDFDGQPTASALIAAVLEHPRYDDGFIGPWTEFCSGVHGPNRRETLTVQGFRPCSTATAWAKLMDWPAINFSPWVSRELIESQEIVAAWVSPLIIAADEIIGSPCSARATNTELAGSPDSRRDRATRAAGRFRCGRHTRPS
jgi:hypothetical protein